MSCAHNLLELFCNGIKNQELKATSVTIFAHNGKWRVMKSSCLKKRLTNKPIWKAKYFIDSYLKPLARQITELIVLEQRPFKNKFSPHQDV